MIRTAIIRLFQGLAFVGLALLVAVPYAAWRLSAGPVSLDFLTPHVEEALSGASQGLVMRVDRTVLLWDGWERGLNVRVENLRALDAAGRTVAMVPEAAVTFAAGALARGIVAPLAVELIGPLIHVHRDEKGVFGVSLGGSPDGAVETGPAESDSSRESEGGYSAEGFVPSPASGERDGVRRVLAAALQVPDDPRHPGAYLRRVSVTDGELVLEDRLLGITWRAPEAALELHRDGDGLGASATIAVEQPRGRASLVAGLRYQAAADSLEVVVTLADLWPAPLAGLHAELAPLKALDLPVGGTVTLDMDGTGALLSTSVSLRGDAGSLHLPPPFAATYGVRSMDVRALVLGLGETVDVEHLSFDIGGPRIEAAGLAVLGEEGVEIEVEGRVLDVPVNALPELWPRSLAVNPRTWVTENLKDGTVPSFSASLAMQGPDMDSLAVTRLHGAGRVEGVSVHYLRPMPPVRDASGIMEFDTDNFLISLQGGRAFGLEVEGGRVDLVKLASSLPEAEIDLNVSGPLSDALTLIDSRPLGYAGALGLDPALASGSADVHLAMSFPLLADLLFEDIAMRVEANLRDVALKEVVFGHDLSDGRLDLTIDPSGMDVTGEADISGIGTRLEWRENFTDAAFASRYRVWFTADDADRARLGLDGAPFQPPMVSGPAVMDVSAVLDGDGGGRLEARIDLTRTVLRLEALDWTKESGENAQATVSARIEDHRIAAVPQLSVDAADGFSLKGSVAFDDQGAFDSLRVQELKTGRTDVAGRLSLGEDDWLFIELTSGVLDVAHALDAASPASGEEPEQGLGTPMTVSLSLDKVWVTETGALTDLAGFLTRNEDRWTAIGLRAALPTGDPISVSIAPDPRGRQVEIATPNAGEALRVFDVFDTMVGGALSLSGVIDDKTATAPMRGMVEITDFHLIEAPILARLLTVAALTGIMDALRGEGIRFNRLEAPFTLRGGVVTLGEAMASGASLGLTARGTIDLAGKRLNVNGTIVPAYAVNALLGNIPLIGGLFRTERGGGLFAATYTVQGDMDAPEVTVNPLSALAPGFLRNLFGFMMPEDADPDDPSAAPSP